MNRRSFILSLCVFLMGGLLLAQPQGYKVRIKIKNSPDTMLLLVNYFGDKQYVNDTAVADKAGYFTFQGDEPLPGGIYIGVTQDKKIFEFIVDREQHFTLETDTADLTANMKVKGSNDNTLFFEYLNFLQSEQLESQKLLDEQKKLIEENKPTTEIDKKFKQINEKIKQYKLDFIKDYPESFLSVVFRASREPEIPEEIPTLPNGKKDSTFAYRYYKEHYWDGFDFGDDRLVRTPVLHNKIDQYIFKTIAQFPDSIIKETDWLAEKFKDAKENFKFLIWYITYQAETSKIMGFDAIFVHMVEKYYMTGQAYWINQTVLENITKRAMTLKPLLIGNKAPNLVMVDTIPQIVSMQNIKADYTILYFWDPDCGHCAKETPVLRDFYLKSKEEYNLEVFGVCTEPDIEKVKKAIKKYELTWINACDPNNMSNFHAVYDIVSTPVAYILDKDKNILAKKLSVEQIEDFIKKLSEQEKKEKFGRL